jgi:hypothetical protein
MCRLWAATTDVLVCLVFGTMSVSGQDATPGPPSLSPVAGTVSLTVHPSGASGNQLEAMLFRPDELGLDRLGSCTVDVTRDPFEDTGDIREGSPWLDERPMSERPVAVVVPGTYRLVIWIGQDLGPYGEWVPAAPIETMCSIDLTVNEARRPTSRFRSRQAMDRAS